MPTDMHCHWLPEALAEHLRARTSPPFLEPAQAGENLQVSSETYRVPIPFGPIYTDIEARLAFMDDVGIATNLLSLPGLFGIDSLPAAESGPLVRIFNDETAALCRQHPLRFCGLAALPIADPEACVAELRRARQTLGLYGAILPVNAFLDLEQAQRMRPLFEAGEALGVHFFIHPGPIPRELQVVAPASPEAIPADNTYQRHITLEVQAKLSSAMVTFLGTDFLDPYPNVSIHVANLGGTYPFLVERLEQIATHYTHETFAPERTRRCYVDCASFGPRAIELAAAVFGVDRVLCGSDYPIFSAEFTLASIRATRLSKQQQQAVLTGNAATLLKRFA